ncbi:MAG: hypothetical protein WBV70_04710 [Candidatus Bathyarchaeia archaeon]
MHLLLSFHTLSVWSTRSFTGEYLEKIVRAGGKVVQKRTTVPAVGYVAYWTDTEGNVLGIMQAHEKTK